ncbi:unnamed protein product [Rhizoctonia solani]|nr:unnamed protein product [Rhizoctonia solani]
MELGLIHFMEDEIKEVIMNIIEDSLGRTFLIPHACSGETSSLTSDVLRNDLRLALRDLLNLANTGNSIDNDSTQFHLKSKDVHDTPFGEEFSATAKAKELNFNRKPVGQSTMNMNAIDWYRWLFNHLLSLILRSLHIVFGVELFAFGLSGIQFVAVDDKLGHAVTRLKGLKTVTRSDLERFVDEIRVLTQKQHKFATWRRNPWTDVCELIMQDISVNVLEEIEKGKPNIQFCGYNLNEDFRPRYTSISALQGHIRERIGIHAKEVESVWLGTAASIRIELEDTLSQVWTMIREDDIIIQQATQEFERLGDRNGANAHPIANLAHATTSTKMTPDQLAASHAKLAGLLALVEHAGLESLAATAAVIPHLPQILSLAKSGQLKAQQMKQFKTLVAMVAKHNRKPIPDRMLHSVQGSPQVPGIQMNPGMHQPGGQMEMPVDQMLMLRQMQAQRMAYPEAQNMMQYPGFPMQMAGQPWQMGQLPMGTGRGQQLQQYAAAAAMQRRNAMQAPPNPQR